MITAATSAEPTYEIVYTQFKSEISVEEQIKLMARLSQIVQKFEGFESRNYFYSDQLDAWVDVVTWSSSLQAMAANELAMKHADALKIFAQMDEKSMIFSHYKQIDSVTK